MAELGDIVRKFRRLKKFSNEVLSIEQFEWIFEVLILWCITKDEDEIEGLITKLQDEVSTWMDEKMGKANERTATEIHGNTNDKIH